MPRYIVKLEDGDKTYYLEWSTIDQAPVTFGMLLGDFRAYYTRQYGKSRFYHLDDRLARVARTGTSAVDHQTVDMLVDSNRAGAKKQKLSREEIIDSYCRKRVLPVGGDPTGSDIKES